MIFELTTEQVEAYEKWESELPELSPEYVTCDSQGITFCFSPTGLGDLVMVARADGYELDLTEYEYF